MYLCIVSYWWLTLLLQPAPCTCRPISKKKKLLTYEAIHLNFSQGTTKAHPVRIASTGTFNLVTKTNDKDGNSDNSNNAEPPINDEYDTDCDKKVAGHFHIGMY